MCWQTKCLKERDLRKSPYCCHCPLLSKKKSCIWNSVFRQARQEPDEAWTNWSHLLLVLSHFFMTYYTNYNYSWVCWFSQQDRGLKLIYFWVLGKLWKCQKYKQWAQKIKYNLGFINEQFLADQIWDKIRFYTWQSFTGLYISLGILGFPKFGKEMS